MPAKRSWVTLSIDLTLPSDFCVADVLAFHGRDAEAVSERVYTATKGLSDTAFEQGVDKALLWDGLPACLCIRFSANALPTNTAHVILNVDTEEGELSAACHKLWLSRLALLSGHILGLHQDLDNFEKHIAGHKELASLVGRNKGLRVPLSVSPFEALCWAVTGQQISVSAAVSIRRRFIQLLGIPHSSGLLCHPNIAAVASANVDQLRSVGLSLGKASCLIALASAIQNETLDLPPPDSGARVNAVSAEVIRTSLLSIRGIGPWTVNYALLRGFGYLDGSLHGDVAVRRSLQTLLGREQKISADETEQWLAQFSPWRALVAAHLWAMQSDDGF